MCCATVHVICFLVAHSTFNPQIRYCLVVVRTKNGDVATREDMRTTKVKFFKKYLFEGMSDPGKIIRPGR